MATEKHGKVQAIVGPSQLFAAAQSDADGIEARRLARLHQTIIEQNRLIRHQRIALDLATAPAAERKNTIAHARNVVERWWRDQLCSLDYTDRWSAILQLPVKEMAVQMTSDDNAWGRLCARILPGSVCMS